MLRVEIDDIGVEGKAGKYLKIGKESVSRRNRIKVSGLNHSGWEN